MSARIWWIACSGHYLRSRGSITAAVSGSVPPTMAQYAKSGAIPPSNGEVVIAFCVTPVEERVELSFGPLNAGIGV